MALTDQEHQRLEALQTEAIGIVENGATSPSASAAFARIATVCRNVLSREAEKRKRSEFDTKLKAAREKRKTQKGSGIAQANIPAGAASR